VETQAYNHYYITVIDDEHGKLEVEMLNGSPFIHLTLHEWSPQLFKEYKNTFKAVLSKMKEEGITQVYVLIPNDDPKLKKFEKMFGFKELNEGNGMLLMYQEIE